MPGQQLGNTALTFSPVGFGASSLGNAFGAIDPIEGAAAVRHAIDRGMNYFDVSPYYGLTLAETRLGEALEGRRSEVLLSTKCGRYGAAEFDFSASRITAGLEDSLRRLRTDHVDLLLAHDVEFGDLQQIVDETIPAMRRMQAAGKTRYVGISGYPLGALEWVMERAPLDAVLTYCHANPLINDLRAGLLSTADRLGVGVINASPLHMGILGGQPVPDWHPADSEVRAIGPVFAATCRQFGADPGAIALAISLECPGLASTLCGMDTRAQVDANLAAAGMLIPTELRSAIEALLAPVRNRTWASGREENSRLGAHHGV